MNNEEFAEQLTELILELNSTGIDNLKQVILNCLTKNDLKIINTKDQLLGFSSEDVFYQYQNNLDYYYEVYGFDVPEALTHNQCQDILQLANRIYSKHDSGFNWDDIDKAISNWLDANYPKKENYNG